MASCMRCGVSVWPGDAPHACIAPEPHKHLCPGCNTPKPIGHDCGTCIERSREHASLTQELNRLRKLCKRQQDEIEKCAEFARGPERIFEEPIGKDEICPICGRDEYADDDGEFYAVSRPTAVEGRTDVLKQSCHSCKSSWLVRPLDWPDHTPKPEEPFESVTDLFEIPGWKIARSRKRWIIGAVVLWGLCIATNYMWYAYTVHTVNPPARDPLRTFFEGDLKKSPSGGMSGEFTVGGGK